jgi:hypothetical protein
MTIYTRERLMCRFGTRNSRREGRREAVYIQDSRVTEEVGNKSVKALAWKSRSNYA